MKSRPGAHLPQAAREAGRRIDQPEAGYFTTRLVRGGVWVPARIVHDFGAFQAFIDGKACGPPHTDPYKAEGVMGLWQFAHAIDRDTYDRLTSEKASRPDPRKPVDLNALPPIF